MCTSKKMKKAWCCGCLHYCVVLACDAGDIGKPVNRMWKLVCLLWSHGCLNQDAVLVHVPKVISQHKLVFAQAETCHFFACADV